MMSLYTFTNELKKGYRIILLFAAGFLGVGVLYSVFLFKPTFSSTSKVLIEEVTPITFVAELGKGRNLETNSQEKNPILTQIEILSSQDLAGKVYSSLLRQNAIKNLKHSAAEAMIHQIQDSIKLKTPPATDIIEVKVTWHEPVMSYLVNQSLLEEYRKYNVKSNKESSSQAKKYIKEQLDLLTGKLQETRRQIRNFKKANASVDLSAEASSIVKEIADAQNTLFALDSQIRYHNGKVSEYSSKLHVNPAHLKDILDSVALGQNGQLSNLHRELSESEQQYSSLKVRYPDTTKKVTALKENISEIKRQIQSQIASTVGENKSNNGKMVIQDSIRTQMVNDLINNQVEMLSLNAKRKSLQGQLLQLKTHELKIPAMQTTLSELMDREINLVSIVNALTSKLVEANVRESGIVSNINIVQRPTYPDSASFPSAGQIILIMSILGASVGCLTVLVRYYLLDIVDASEVESIVNLPVLGQLSWVSGDVYNNLSRNQLLSGGISLEYERIATSLKVNHEDNGTKVFGFSSLADTGRRSSIVVSIAKLLSQCNYSVLLIDADFRHSSIALELGLDATRSPDMKELLTNEYNWKSHALKELVAAGELSTFSEDIKETQGAYFSQIDQYITKLEGERSLYLMMSEGPCSNSYELVTSKLFPSLIEAVREQFDFVLVDMPPLLATSDSLIIARLVDGIVTLCGLNCSKGQLKAARKLCDDNSINMIGTITKYSN